MKLLKQTERRTSAERRDYMQQYHARRRLYNGSDAGLPPVPIPEMPRCPSPGRVFFLRDDAVRHHLRDGSGRLMWPERRKTHPETLAETLKRSARRRHV
jgi:hypothetical protein